MVSLGRERDPRPSCRSKTVSRAYEASKKPFCLPAPGGSARWARLAGKGSVLAAHPPLGYDIVDTKLVINEPEAQKIRTIFQLYLEHEAVLPVAQELNRRGWRTKSWTTKKGRVNTGKPFEKGRVHRILTNWQYVGKVRYQAEVYPGEHEAIVSEEVWNRAQQILQRNRLNGGAHQRSKHGALLNGLREVRRVDGPRPIRHQARLIPPLLHLQDAAAAGKGCLPHEAGSG